MGGREKAHVRNGCRRDAGTHNFAPAFKIPMGKSPAAHVSFGRRRHRRVAYGGHCGQRVPRHDPHDVARVAALVDGRVVERAKPSKWHGLVQSIGTQSHHPTKGGAFAPLVRLDDCCAVRQLCKLAEDLATAGHDAPVANAHVRASKSKNRVVDGLRLALERVAGVVAHHRKQWRVQAATHRFYAPIDDGFAKGAHVAREAHCRSHATEVSVHDA